MTSKSKSKPKVKASPKKAKPKASPKPKAAKPKANAKDAKPKAAPAGEAKRAAAPEGAKGKGKRGRPAKALPNDPVPVDDAKDHGPRIPATVILCQLCGEPNHVPTTTTATSIRCKCGRCENLITVTGAKLAKLRVGRDSIRLADQLALMPTALEPHVKGKGESRQRVPEYTVVRIKCTNTQHAVISIAMEVARRMSSDDNKDWSGRSLELICADFLSGAPANVVQAVTEERKKAAEAADAVERQRAS